MYTREKKKKIKEKINTVTLAISLERWHENNVVVWHVNRRFAYFGVSMDLLWPRARASRMAWWAPFFSIFLSRQVGVDRLHTATPKS